jgi:hypothetical protein
MERVKYETKPMGKWKSPAKSGGTFPLSHRLCCYSFLIYFFNNFG